VENIVNQEVVHGIPRDQPTAIPPALGSGCRCRGRHRVRRWLDSADANEARSERQHNRE
jgi:hypothetical protein